MYYCMTFAFGTRNTPSYLTLYKKKLTKPYSAPLAQRLHISEMPLHSPETKMYILPLPPDLAASVTNPGCLSTDRSEHPRSRSVIGRRGAKLYSGEWICASETRR